MEWPTHSNARTFTVNSDWLVRSLGPKPRVRVSIAILNHASPPNDPAHASGSTLNDRSWLRRFASEWWDLLGLWEPVIEQSSHLRGLT